MPQTVDKGNKRDRHVATLLAMTEPKAYVSLRGTKCRGNLERPTFNKLF